MEQGHLSYLAQIMETAAAETGADCISLTLPCQTRSRVRVFARGPTLPNTLDFVTVPAQDSLCQRVIRTGLPVQGHPRSGGTSHGRCGMMMAEGLTSYLGYPILDRNAFPVAAMSIMTHMPRIWSRADRNRLDRLVRLIETLDLLTDAIPKPILVGDSFG